MENLERPIRPEEQKEHIDKGRLETLAHFWLLLLRKKGIAPEQISNKEKEWPRIEEYTDEEVAGLFRADPDENKKFWEEFKKDWKHIEECRDCSKDFEDIFWGQFR